MAKLNVRIDDQLDEDLEVAVARRKTTKQAATNEALKVWLSSIANSGNQPVTIKGSVNTSTGIPLTEYELDILAMLKEDPERDFLFSSIQTTVSHALEQYRRKWKPKETPKPKAASKSGEPERRSSGTR